MKLALQAPVLLSRCKGFRNPIRTSFTLTNSRVIKASLGATSGNAAMM